jgi:CubicO group peptidase (beta-lactamase class C family)
VCAAVMMIASVAGAQGISEEAAKGIDVAIEEAIGKGKIPGAVVLLGKEGRVVYRKAYGNRAVQPEKTPMREETVFDLASLTKPVACATSIMMLVERGKIGLQEPVSKYISAFGVNGKEKITVEQLLTHVGGLIPDNAMADYRDGPKVAWEKICALKPVTEPGTKFAYTDVGFIVLGELVKVVDGRPLDQFAKEEIFEPLGMKETGYQPSEEIKARCALTEKRGERWMQGEVHDPRAYALGGVAGHAGLFSTADDLAKFCFMLVNGGEYEGKRILAEKTAKLLAEPVALPGKAYRSRGWDVDTGYSATRGERFEKLTTFGHTGFTGTMMWIDPKNKCFVILLTNRVHPDGKGEVGEVRKKVATLAAEGMLGKKE